MIRIGPPLTRFGRQKNRPSDRGAAGGENQRSICRGWSLSAARGRGGRAAMGRQTLARHLRQLFGAGDRTQRATLSGRQKREEGGRPPPPVTLYFHSATGWAQDQSAILRRASGPNEKYGISKGASMARAAYERYPRQIGH